jgi:hypothetical protein
MLARPSEPKGYKATTRHERHEAVALAKRANIQQSRTLGVGKVIVPLKVRAAVVL